MLKSEIIKKLKKKHQNLTTVQIEDIINTIFDHLSKNIIEKKPIELRNFGRWYIKDIKPKYNARNPKTGETIYIPAKKKISFRMSKHLKEVINKKNEK